MTEFSSTGPSTGDLCYRGDNGFIGIKEGTTATVYIGWAILNYTYLTDNQSLSVVLGDQGIYTGAKTYLYTHSTTTHTAGAYCAIAWDSITVGTYTRSGSTYTYTPFTGTITPVSLHRGDIVEVRNAGTSWFVLINNIDFPLTIPVVTGVSYDGSHRSAMISMERKYVPAPFNIYEAGEYESVRIKSLIMSDYVVPAFAGSGAKMKATGTSSVTASSGSNILSSFFNGVAMSTADYTVDASTSKFTVSIRGHYMVVMRTKNTMADGTNGGAELDHVLYHNGAVFEWGSAITTGWDGISSVVWPNSLQSVWTIHLEPGDYVQAGYNATTSLTNGFTQTSDGVQNVFSIALLTRNLL